MEQRCNGAYRQRASDQRSKFDPNIATAYFLQTIIGISCGSRELMLHTEISRASLVTSQRRLHLLRPGRSAVDDLLSDNPEPTVEEKWKAWLEDEGRRRLGWAIFVSVSLRVERVGTDEGSCSTNKWPLCSTCPR